ncbi:allophanate hydrolase-related protein [Mycolicibacterium hippocampi]|uniref:Allophanate hydrolase C-terminal domain-containing protein n=1 Tax=Mycolicibacterium hippocampi TaxID=659824 RepID=A0A7I9ZU16_9MYCO|nr:hypothetical protein [Mycolicibacterium hippocampi]GFH04226.1 hypothetical protein MHIP_47090 [Mycolicibacterium hippocampi]
MTEQVAGRAAPGSLAGRRVVVADTVGDAAVGALRSAGAVIVDNSAFATVDGALGDGHADVVVTAAAPAGSVCITPTATALPARLSVLASDLVLADAVTAVLAGQAPGRGWPADIRLAAPVEPVVGVALHRHDRRVLGAVTAALTKIGARIVPVPVGTYSVPHGVDAVVVAADSTDRDGLCSVTVSVDGAALTVLARAFDDAVAVDLAAGLIFGRALQSIWPLSAADPVELVVFGAHLRGGPLVHQLTDLGARWAGEIITAPRYRMTVLSTSPAKPAITRVFDGEPGAALHGHRWLMSAAALGRFLAALPAPMQLGKVEFDDGSWRTAFGCEASAAVGADISSYGSWTRAVAAGAVRVADPPRQPPC